MAWTTAKRWRIRPSSFYGIHDELSAYCFDNAVSIFGNAVEDAMKQGAKGAKTEEESERRATSVLEQWLAGPGQAVDIRNDPAYRMPTNWV